MAVDALKDDDQLARFLTQKGQFRKSDNSIKASAFLPRFDADLDQFAVSTFAVRDLSGEEIGDLGREFTKNAHRFYGWTTIEKAQVESVGLEVDFDNQPERHANILGWHGPSEESGKAFNISLAQELANLASTRQAQTL